MRAVRPSFTCPQCLFIRPRATRAIPFARSASRLYSSSSSSSSSSSNSSEPHDRASQKQQKEQLQQHNQRPTTAPRPNIDIKHIRENADLYQQNCLARNYKQQSTYPARIVELFGQWQASQRRGRSLRERSNALRRQIANPATIQHEDEADEASRSASPVGTDEDGGNLGDAASTRDVRTMTRDELLEEARLLKQALSAIEDEETQLSTEMTNLALAIPNLTLAESPRDGQPRVLSYINEPKAETDTDAEARTETHEAAGASDRVWRSHVHIGAELGILDFASAASSSGWGWYYLVDEGAQLEQALVAYALSTVSSRRAGWRQVAPPSIVYSHMAAACGFQPRDQHGETQIYALSQSQADAARGKPELCLAGTAEIPLAAMRADSIFESTSSSSTFSSGSSAGEIPAKRVGVSRSYRAEAGARGADTKGLYRVHEFTKVEMFAWTSPDLNSATAVFDEMVAIQSDILASLGLRCRVLEMPTTDLGASAARKIDIEAFFPSRAAQGGLNDGWGEVTSTSICGDYQTRRLATRMRLAPGSGSDGGKLVYPWTVNGTALAVPRVLAAILENGWDEAEMAVTIPECLRPWMGGLERIEAKRQRG
ncbi:hypothetical protein F4777DRAFT_130812 [Nemania sp. FL0916]|nr:hypothetical protein F4777DRAFT_130812 [Nemania sp. FL0916]